MTPLRSVAVFHIGGVGGPQRSLGAAIRLLEERGTVEFLVPEPGPTADEYGRIGPVDVRDYAALTYARGARGLAQAARRLARDIALFRREWRSRRPDLVLVVTTVLPAAVLAARLERIPTVVYAAELYEQEWKRSPLRRVWGGLLVRLIALADGIVCCSEAVAGQFAGRTRKPLKVAYPPIGPEYATGDRERGRARLGLAPDDVCVTVVGSITRGRGQDVAIAALARVRERVPAARLVLVGEPHPRALDRAYADELRELADHDDVVFAGPQPSDALADVYAASDVVLNPARSESFGRVAPEALVAGRPVVATRVGGIPEAVRDGVDGLLVAADDSEALAVAVLRVLEAPDSAKAMVASGRRRALERFGPEQDAAAWSRIIEAVVAKRGLEPARVDSRRVPDEHDEPAGERHDQQAG